MASQACVPEHTKRYTDTWSHIPQLMHHTVHKRGQINSSTLVICGKQISYLIYCFAAWHCRVQGCSQNLPSAFNPFSFFPFFFSYSADLLSLAYSLNHFLIFSFFPSNRLSFLPLFMLLEFHRWGDLRQWRLCKTQFKWMQGSHNENGIKGMHTKMHLTLLWHEDVAAEAEKYISYFIIIKAVRCFRSMHC